MQVESTAGNGKAILVYGYSVFASKLISTLHFFPPLERITEPSGSAYHRRRRQDINFRQSPQHLTFKGLLSVEICKTWLFFYWSENGASVELHGSQIAVGGWGWGEGKKTKPSASSIFCCSRITANWSLNDQFGSKEPSDQWPNGTNTNVLSVWCKSAPSGSDSLSFRPTALLFMGKKRKKKGKKTHHLCVNGKEVRRFL